MTAYVGPAIFSVPFFDESTQSTAYWTEGPDAGAIFDDTLVNEYFSRDITKLALLNKQSGDWQVTYDVTTLTQPQFFNGPVEVDSFGVALVLIVLDNIPGYVDYWYNSKDFANFGVFQWQGQPGFQASAPHWMNSPNYQFIAGRSDNGGFFFYPKPGVTGFYQYANFGLVPQMFVNFGAGPIAFATNLDQIHMSNFL